MSKRKHLTEEALLELAGKRLSPAEWSIVEEHLVHCRHCRERAAEFQYVHSVFKQFAHVTQDKAAGTAIKPAGAHIGTSAFPWAWAGAIAFGCVCILFLLFQPGVVPEASASALLDNAVKSESAETAFSIHVSDKACASGQGHAKLIALETSAPCSRALQQMKETKWGHENPLSARTYAAWRDSLHKRHDEVAKKHNLWQIKTTTTEGVVFAASLEMRASDYHPIKVTLNFSDNEKISIAEEEAPLAPAPLPPPVHVAKQPLHRPPEYTNNPGDELEVQAWMMLQELKADTGWEASVFRNGPQVRVEAIGATEEQRQQFQKAFAAHSEVEVNFFQDSDSVNRDGIAPERIRLDGEEPALANAWLLQQFPADNKMRENFSDNALHLSRVLLGRAFFLDKLRQRRQVLIHCSCARDLSQLIASESRTLIGLQMSLASMMEPLIGSGDHLPPEALTYSQAQDLDVSLQELLYRSASSDPTAFTDRVQEVRTLLADSKGP